MTMMTMEKTLLQMEKMVYHPKRYSYSLFIYFNFRCTLDHQVLCMFDITWPCYVQSIEIPVVNILLSVILMEDINFRFNL